MAENTKELGEAINQPLKELSFEHIIGEPLRACVDAQQEAAIATYQYMKAVGFEKDPSLLADFKPTQMVFYFEKDGVVNRLSIPMLTILPVPYLMIGRIDLHFKAEVTGWDNDKDQATFTYATSGTNIEGEGTQKVESSSEIQAKETLDIRVHATSSDLPAGMAKLMEILDTQMTDMYDVKKGNA